MKLVYAGNWFALGACIYGRKSPDEALKELGLRKPHKRRLSRTDIDVNELIRLRNKGLTILKSIFIVSIFIMKIESVALSIALVLWLVGLFGVTGGDVLRVLAAFLGTFIVSLASFVIADMKR